ncbi:MAG TPA: multidrug effflux MFS transporter [Actinomycetaceae bacterium]|nr:multidrug effflux MFS transporter [Actinomycetaceae bacterium]
MTERRTPKALVVLLASLTSLGPLSISFYLPALPYLVDEFGVTEAQAQLTMTATLIGLAAGQLILGTVSDARGRRSLLLIALAGFAVVSLAIALVGNLWAVIVLRVLQGFFASGGIVLSRAIVRDTSSRRAVGRINARLLLVITVTPLVAPSIGAQVLIVSSWRLMFVFLAAIAAIFFVIVAVTLPETLKPEERRAGGLSSAGRAYVELFSNARFRALMVMVGVMMTSYFTYITASAFVFQDGFGLSTQQFGILYGAGAIMLTAGTQLGGQLFDRVSPERLAALAFSVAILGSAVMVVMTTLSGDDGGPSLVAFLVALLPTLLANGLLISTSQGLVLSQRGGHAGSRAAMLGAVQFGVGALGAPISGLFGSTALAMAGVMGTGFVLGVLALVVVRRRP